MSMFYENELHVKVNKYTYISKLVRSGNNIIDSIQRREARKKILPSHIKKNHVCLLEVYNWRRTKYMNTYVQCKFFLQEYWMEKRIKMHFV